MAEGLLPVARDGLNGDIERRLAAGWFRQAGIAGEFADRAAARDGEKAALKATIAGAPQPVEITRGAKTFPLPDGAARPFKTTDPVAQGLAPHQMALLNAIAGGESGGKYNIRYTPQGGALFDDVTKHPRIMEPTKSGQKSSAAGRYQFTATTWDAMGGGDFSPENQDLRALRLAGQVYKQKTGRDLDGDLTAGGLTPQIVGALSDTWEAFKHGADRHVATYQDSLKRYAAGGSKADAKASAAAASVAPPAIEPVVMRVADKKQEAVSGTSHEQGNQGNMAVSARKRTNREAKKTGFKSMRGNSVYERSYNATGLRTYLQQLNVAIQTDVMNVFDKLGSDPAEFDKGLAALKTLHLEEHGVPDEIRADYEMAFAKASLPFQQQARLEQKKRIEDQNKADFQERIVTLESERTRRLSVLSMDNEEAVAALWQVQDALEDHLDASVLHGVMSQSQAGQAKRISRRGAALQFYEKQAEGKTSAEIRAMREELAQDFGNGQLEHVDGDGWLMLEASLKKLENGQNIEEKKQVGDYVNRGQMLLARLEMGYEIDPDSLAQFSLDQNKVDDGQKIHDQMMEQMQVVRVLRDMPLSEAVNHVRQMQTQMGDTPSDAEISLLHYAKQALETKQEMLAKDPLTYAEALRLIAPLNGLLEDMTPQGLEAAMKQRITAAQQVAAHFGTPPRFFKQGEAAEIGKMVSNNPEFGAVLAGSLVQAAGDDAGQVLREFGDQAPQILAAGAILAMGGNAQAAADVIYGSADKDEEGRAYKNIEPHLRRGWEDNTLGVAAQWMPEDKERIASAAYAISKRQIYLNGIDVKDEAAVEEIYQAALNQAAGQVTIGGEKYGGFVDIKSGFSLGSKTKVLVMPEIRADRFEAVMAAIKMSDFDDAVIKPVQFDGKTPLPDGNFWRLYPVTFGGGYRLSTMPVHDGGTPRWIMGSDGEPFVYNPLDYKDKLAVRVPGAFRP